jgi:hypothetical protein
MREKNWNPEYPTLDKNWYRKWYPEYPIIIDDDEGMMEAQERDDYDERFQLLFSDGARCQEPYLVDKETLQHAISEKNKLFNEELSERGLCLAVTRTWGNRTLPTKSEDWKALRMKVLEKANYSCRYCGLRSKKWMVCDHIDGDASNNSIENLGINCPVCDLIRHCGRAGKFRQLSIWESSLGQLEIVKFTQQYWIENKSIPEPLEIDPSAIFVTDATAFGGKLMTVNYSELSERELRFRGFFMEDAKSEFAKVLNHES